MKFIRTSIPDVVIGEPKLISDSRGYFMEAFRQDLWEEFLGIKLRFIQENESKSQRGVLRGLHYQLPKFAQTKLVRVLKGKVLDVAVDIRKGSCTFGQHVTVELSEDNKRQLFVPRGFAHGFVVLSDEAVFSYKVDNIYSLLHERGLDYRAEELGINWILEEEELILSPKDKGHSGLTNIECFDFNLDLYQ